MESDTLQLVGSFLSCQAESELQVERTKAQMLEPNLFGKPKSLNTDDISRTHRSPDAIQPEICAYVQTC